MKNSFMISVLFCLVFISCNKDEPLPLDTSYNPDISPSKFTNSTRFTNPYATFPIGKEYIYEGHTSDGQEKIVITRLNTTKIISGIICIVVNDKAYNNGILVEDTDDWYAQDNDGNVWYFGEFVKNYNDDGSFKNNSGSWEAGVDGAKAGIYMLANPVKGMKYRQEYYYRNAEDEAEVLETGISLITSLGSFTNCVKTRDFTKLEPDVNEHKTYAPNIGLIREFNVVDNETIDLIEIK